MDTMELGREMMSRSGDLKDDKQCCEWARIGQMLTQLGTPKMPKTFFDMQAKDRMVVLDAVKALQKR
jgi:hypothetical protein